MTREEKDQIRQQYQRLQRYERLELSIDRIKKAIKAVEDSSEFNIDWHYTISYLSSPDERSDRNIREVFDTYVAELNPQIREFVLEHLKRQLDSLYKEMEII